MAFMPLRGLTDGWLCLQCETWQSKAPERTHLLAEWQPASLGKEGKASEEAEDAAEADEGYESSVDGLDDFEDILVCPPLQALPILKIRHGHVVLCTADGRDFW